MFDRSDRRFLTGAAVGLLLSLIPLIALAVRLAVLGELPAPGRSESALHGTWFVSDWPDYKLAEAQRKQSDVVVLGSSRVLQVRQAHFARCDGKACFYNAGGAMLTVETGLEVFRELLRVHRPRVLVLGLDVWQFNPHWDRTAESFRLRRDPLTHIRYALEVTRGTAALLLEETAMREVILGQVATRDDREGLEAHVRGSGFRPDGSYAYPAEVASRLLSRPGQALDSTDLDAIQRGCCFWTPFDHAEERDLMRIDELLKLARDNGVAVVALTLPFSDGVAAAIDAKPNLRAGVEDVYRSLTALFSQHGVPFAAFHRMSDAKCADAERWDGHHMSEVCLGRVIAAVAAGPARMDLLPYVDSDALARAAAASSDPRSLGP